MISIDRLRVIAKAKFSDKSKLGDWYQKRMDICKECPLNSTNKKDLSVREKGMVTLNFGKPTCLGCGCEIAAKGSVREEECGLVKLGQPPLWEKLPEIKTLDLNKIKVSNLNSDKAILSVTNEILLDYGTVEAGFDSKVDLEIESITGSIEAISIVTGCGCTTAATKTVNGKGLISISYDTVGRRGSAKKSFTIYYTANKKKEVVMGKLLINVKEKTN